MPTFEEFMGGGEAAAPAKASSSTPSAMSFDDFMGKSPDPTAGMEHQSDASIAFGGVKAAGRAVAREVGSFADILTSVPGGIAGSIGEIGMRAGLSRSSPDVSQRAAASAGREFREYISEKGSPTWFTDAVNLMTPEGETPDETHVTKAMAWVQKKIDQGGEIVDTKTGGKFNKDDVSMFANLAMNAVAGKLTKGGPNIKELLAKKEKPAAPPGPPDLNPLAEQMAARRKYTDDAEYAKHFQQKAADEAHAAQNEALRSQRQAEAKGVESPRTPPSRPTILKADGKVDNSVVGQRSLDTGLEKVAKGQAFNLTAEEKIAIRGNARSWGGLIEKGAADPDLLAALAIGGVGVSLALAYPDKVADAVEPLAAGLFMTGNMKSIKDMPEASSKAAINAKLDTTLKIWEAIPDNRTEMPKSWFEDQLRRPEITKAEKEVVQPILDGYGPTSKYTKLGKEHFSKPGQGKFIDADGDAVGNSGDHGVALEHISESTGIPFEGHGMEADLEEMGFGVTKKLGLTYFDHSSASETHAGSFISGKDQMPKQEVIAAAVKYLQKSGKKTATVHYDAEVIPVKAADKVGAAGPNISVKEFAVRFKEATGDWELKEAPTEEFADYGLEAIDRDQGYDPWRGGDEMSPDEIARKAAGENIHPQKAKTSIWQLPEHMQMGTDNHFGDPQYFGHTRSFEEGGVKHVVEIQSDLAQKAGKVLTEAERTKLTNEAYDLQADRASTKARLRNHEEGTTILDYDTYRELERRVEDMTVNLAEIQAKLGEAAVTSQIAPLLKNWHKRLVREELAASARERGKVETQLAQARVAGEPEAIALLEGKLSNPTVVRFATADTVAKVEGWPKENAKMTAAARVRQLTRSVKELESSQETYTKLAKAARERSGNTPEMVEAQDAHLEMIQRSLDKAKTELGEAQAKMEAASDTDAFSPQHQGIYNRYKGDVEKFLKQLGGQAHTDASGHTWIDVPYTPGMKRVQQFGRADVDLLIGVAAVGMGVAAGISLDPENPLVAGALGAMVGAGIRNIPVGAIFKDIKSIAKAKVPERISDLTNAHEYTQAQFQRSAMQIAEKLVDLVKDPKTRVEVFQALDEGKIGTLTGKAREAALTAQRAFAELRTIAEKEGVLDNFLADYATHFWDKASKTKLDQMMAAERGDPMSPNSRFNKKRTYPTMAEGKAAGLKPLTEDIASVLNMYTNSLGRTIANKRLIDGLSQAKSVAGFPLVAKLGKAPDLYVSIDSPHFRGKLVHPDIAPSLKFLFESQTPGAMMGALTAVNTALKRNSVSLSLFHATTLQHAMLGATNNSALVAKVTGEALSPHIFGENKFLKMFKEGGAGDMVDLFLKSGGKISMEFRDTAMEDVHGGSYYKAMEWLGASLDRSIPHSGAPVRAYMALNHAVDTFMWSRLHAAMKLEVFAAKVEAAVENTAKTGKPLTREQAGVIAASYVNDIFGGLNWRRLAEGVENKYLRTLALDMVGPSGRRALQLLLFAPDWTLSTTRSFTQMWAKGGGTGIKGLFQAKALADFHRQQLLRSAAIYLTVGDGINYAMSGHHIWENKEKDGKDSWKAMTRVDLGDGRTMQLSKHLMEPIDWIIDPQQQALNKMGALPKQAAEQALGVQYLSAHGRMPPIDKAPGGRIGHVAKAFSPIGVQQFRDGGVTPGVSGGLGYPIYGKTAEQRRKDKLEAALKRYSQTHSQEKK